MSLWNLQEFGKGYQKRFFFLPHCLGSLGVNLGKLKIDLLGFLGLDLGNRSIGGVGTLKVDEF